MSDTSTRVDRPPSTPTRSSRRWIGLAVILCAAFMDLADVTIVNVALPTISDDLKPSVAGLQWITAGYSVTFAIFMITGGRLGDIYGRRLVFVVGTSIFTIASLIAGLSGSADMLIAARIVQGVGAGLMVPQVLSIINVSFHKEDRVKAFGMYGATIGLATVLGQLIGAALIELDIAGTAWRPIFLVNIPVGVAAVAFGLKYLDESKNEDGKRSLDLVGVGGIAVTLFLLLFPLTVGRERGWPWWGWIMMAAAAVALAATAMHQMARDRAGKEALIAPHVFQRRSTCGGFAVQVVFATAAGLFFLTWIMYMQIGLGWSPIRAAVTGLAFAIAAAISSGFAIQVLAPKIGRGTVLIGASTMLVGTVVFAVLCNTVTEMTSLTMAIPLAIMGFGMGSVVSPLADLVLSDVPADDSGAVSGVFNTLNQVGLAVGIALTSVAFFHVLDGKDTGRSDAYASAFEASLYWIIALLALVVALGMIIPAKLRLVPEDADKTNTKGGAGSEPAAESRNNEEHAL